MCMLACNIGMHSHVACHEGADEQAVPMAEMEARIQAAKLRPAPLKAGYLEKKGEAQW